MFERKQTRNASVRLLSLLSLLLILAASCAAGEAAEDKLDLLRRLMSERAEYTLVEERLKSFVEEHRGQPVVAEALLLLGYCQDMQKKNAEAAESYARISAEFPQASTAVRVDASVGAASAYFRSGRFGDAIKHFSIVMELGGKPEQNEYALLWRGKANESLAFAEEDAGRPADAYLRAAADDFIAFTEKYPDSKLLPDAVCSAGLARYDLGDYERALALFQRFLKDFPDDGRAAECQYHAAESLLRLKRHPEAHELFVKLVAKDRTGEFAAAARAGQAWSDYYQHRVAEAAAGFEEAARLAGDDKLSALEHYYEAGWAWGEAGDPQKAGLALQKVAEDKEHELNDLAWYRLGALWQRQVWTVRERAESETNPKAREKLRATQKEWGEKSVRYFRRALSGGKLGDEEVEAVSLMGEVLLDAGRYQEAAEAFADVASRWPDSDRAPWALYHQGLAERELSQAAADDESRKERLAAAAAALRKSLTYPQARTRLMATWALADYLTVLGEVDASRERYRWLANEGVHWAKVWIGGDGRGDPSLEARAREYAVDSLFRLGESYYFANDYPRAAGFYQEVTGKHPGTPQAAMAMLRLGEVAEAGKDMRTARASYEESLRLGMQLGKSKLGATIGYAQLRLGTLLLRIGQKEPVEDIRRKNLLEAVRNLLAVIAEPPENLNMGRPYYYLAEARYHLGEKKEALADYEKSIAADAKGDLSDAAWFGAAWAKRDLGDLDGAARSAAKVIDDFPNSAVRPDALALTAAIRRAEGDSAGALAVLDRFLSEYRSHSLAPKAELERASSLDDSGRHADAAAAYQEFLKRHPDHPDVAQALYQRSWALWNRIRPKAREAREAEARLKELSGGRDPRELPEADRVEAQKAEEKLRELSGEVRKAEDEILGSLRDLTARYPDYAVVDAAWLRIGEILYDRGEYEPALSAYQKALAAATVRSSDLADKAQYRMAWSIQRLAEAAERESLAADDRQRREAARKEMWDRRIAAIDSFETIVGRFPGSELVGDACFRAAELRRRSGQDNADSAKRSEWFETAAKRYAQALEKGGPDSPYRAAAEYGNGLSLLLNGQSAAARDVFRRLLLNPDGPYVQEAYWGLGQANLNLGAFADAASAFEQALMVDKTTETAAKSQFGLGMTAAMAGDNVKARGEFLTVSMVYPNYPEWAAAALVRAARAALAEDLREKAIEYLEEVLAKYGDTPSAEEAKELQGTVTVGGEAPAP